MAGYYANPNMYGAQNQYNANMWYWMLANANSGSKKDDVSMTIVKLDNLENVFNKTDIDKLKSDSFTPMGVKFPCGVVIPLPNPARMNLAFTKRIDAIVANPTNAFTKEEVIKAMNARLAINYYQNDRCSPFLTNTNDIIRQCHAWVRDEDIASQIGIWAPDADENSAARPVFDRQNATVIG